jgi:hypothetical protein
VTQVLDNDRYLPVEVRATAPLPAPDLGGFARWMGGAGGQRYAWWLPGAPVYENSD